MFFGTEDGADFKDTVESGAHEHLLEELGGLVEEGFLVEVGEREEFGSSLSGGGDDYRGLDLGEFVVPEVFADCTKAGISDLEDGVDAGFSQVEIPVVETGVHFCRDFLRDVEGKRGFGTGDGAECFGDEFPASGCFFGCFDFAFAFDDGFTGRVFDGGEYVGGDFLFGDGDLEYAGSVANEEEGESSKVTFFVDPACNVCMSDCRGHVFYWYEHKICIIFAVGIDYSLEGSAGIICGMNVQFTVSAGLG